MKTILIKLLKLLTNKKNLPYTIGVTIIIVLCVVIYFLFNANTNLKQEIQTEQKLTIALSDSVEYYQNEEEQWVAERLTIQTTFDNFKNLEDKLTANQKVLLEKVENLEKDNHVIAAALIVTQIKIDSLAQGDVEVDITNKTVTFSDSTDVIQYEFVAENVLPAYLDVKPTLNVKKLFLPNEQFIDFHWLDNKKNGFPVSFSVTNSNKYFRTININSYAIPELDKNQLDPTGWQRFTRWSKNNGKVIITVGITATAAAGATYLLTR